MIYICAFKTAPFFFPTEHFGPNVHVVFDLCNLPNEFHLTFTLLAGILPPV